MSAPRIKVCGLRRAADAALAAELGAWALGFVFYAKSPRSVSSARARELIAAAGTPALKVGVFVDASLEEILSTVEHARLTAVQLHGAESPALCAELKNRLPSLQVFKALRPRASEQLDSSAWAHATDALLVDAWSATEAGGTGQRADWSAARALAAQARVILAGGLDPSNVANALKQVQPFALDVSSRLERSPGEKDADKVRRFFTAANGACA
jgi:phosphoribosylanthranilate isomerase